MGSNKGSLINKVCSCKSHSVNLWKKKCTRKLYKFNNIKRDFVAFDFRCKIRDKMCTCDLSVNHSVGTFKFQTQYSALSLCSIVHKRCRVFCNLTISLSINYTFTIEFLNNSFYRFTKGDLQRVISDHFASSQSHWHLFGPIWWANFSGYLETPCGYKQPPLWMRRKYWTIPITFFADVEMNSYLTATDV